MTVATSVPLEVVRIRDWRYCVRFLVSALSGLMLCSVLHGLLAQTLPFTSAETLSGKPIVLANVVRGHEAVLIAGFSHEGGNRVGEWAKALRSDRAFDSIAVYQIAMIAGAPRFVRGMIRSGIKRGVPAADQDHFVVLTKDEQLWRSYFAVSNESDPYVELIDEQGQVLWRGHGSASVLEPQLKGALGR